jgi:hypothetical protein
MNCVFVHWATNASDSHLGSVISWNAGAQLTGGYFANPGFKDVPEHSNLAFPIVDLSEDGSAISTLHGTGGRIGEKSPRASRYEGGHLKTCNGS